MRKWEKLKIDARGALFVAARQLRLQTLCFFTSRITRLVSSMKGVEIGRAAKFYGVPVVHRNFNSRIRIGNRCTFRSDFTSNLIGVNRRCIIATHGEGAIIKIGDDSGFSGTVIGAIEKISIGNNVLCGANVTITDFDWHAVNPEHRNTGVPKSAPIRIEDNVWLGLNVTVLKGVTIGRNSIVGANSLVVSDIPPNVIAGGAPCKPIKSLDSI